MLNRSAITVTAKQPFLDWLRKLPEPVDENTTLERINDNTQVYLVPEEGETEDREGLIKLAYEDIFLTELEAWWTDPKDWPVDRDLKKFSDWFDVHYHSMVEDLVAEPALEDDSEE